MSVSARLPRRRSKPRFAALSYAWGNPNPPSEVAIDGIEHVVSPNLASALRHLRSKNNVISLWADAVCINQADAAEKAKQLFIMGEIYRQAERVLVWLGPESEDSNLAMDAIDRWAAWKYEHPGRRRGSRPRELIGIDLDEVFNEAAFGAIRALLARPYWTRVWIQQEVALGRDVYMHCGPQRVLFDVLEQAASSWKDFWFTALDSPDWAHVFHLGELAAPPTALTNLIQLRRQQQTKIATTEPSAKVGLFDILRSFQHLESSVPHDRIYGLLGLLPPSVMVEPCLKPSYDKNPSHVFCDAARFMIEDDNSLRVVAFARNLVSKAPVAPLPSWVPDWTGIESLYPMHVHEPENFGTKTWPDISRNVRFSANGKVLSLIGVLCDVVAALQPWATQYGRQPHSQQLCNDLRDKFLLNGVSYLRAVFDILAVRHESDTETWSMSDEQAHISMIQVLHFLRLLIPDEGFGEETRAKVAELAQVMLDDRNDAFLKILDWYFRLEAPDGPSIDDEDVVQQRQLLRAIGTVFWTTALGIIKSRVFFESQNGTIGIGPEDTRVGDVVFRPPGFCGFFILWPIDDHYILVGEGGMFTSWAAFGDVECHPPGRLCTVDVW